MWDPPTFKDNFDPFPKIDATIKPGTALRWGIHKNVYSATDKAGNRATCEFEIQLGRKCGVCTWPRGSALFCRAVTSIFSQRFLHKMTNPRLVLIARLHVRKTSRLSQETEFLAPIIPDKLLQCISCKISYARGKQSLHSKWTLISTSTESTWPRWWPLINCHVTWIRSHRWSRHTA